MRNILDWIHEVFDHDNCDIAAMLELGSLAGALTAGVLADRFSRRQSILAACGEYSPSLRDRGLGS